MKRKKEEYNIYLLLLICILIIREGRRNNKDKIELVISRYKENLWWINNLFFDIFEIIIYNKGKKLENKKIKRDVKIIELNNVGACEHTYLTHIINNYDNLNKLTIFLTGSCMEIKLEKTIKTIISTLITNNSVFYCSKYNRPILDIQEIREFKINRYKRVYKGNITNENVILVPSKIRPFYKWYNAIIRKKTKINYINFEGIFCVSREHILNNDIEYYKKINKLIDNDIATETCHYIELAYTSIFYPYELNCIYNFDERLEGKLSI
jgi:hypothetical protein